MAEPRREAVAPVIIKEGGWGEDSTEERRLGRAAWAKRKKPILILVSTFVLLEALHECSLRGHLPISLIPSLILLQRQLQERLPHKSASHIIHGCSQLLALELFLDLRKGALHSFLIRHIGRYADGFSACGVDFFDDGLVVGGVAGQERDWVGFGELESYGTTCCMLSVGAVLGEIVVRYTSSGAYSGDDAVEVACCCHVRGWVEVLGCCC